jgi:hypothetical protein
MVLLEFRIEMLVLSEIKELSSRFRPLHEEAEIRKLLRVLPFQSLYGARQAINALADELD